MCDNKRKSITVTFGKYDEDVYNYLKNERNASALIRHLVRNYMMGVGVPVTPQPIYTQVYPQQVPVQVQQVPVQVQEQPKIEIPVVHNNEPEKFIKREVIPTKIEEKDEDDDRIAKNREALAGLDL